MGRSLTFHSRDKRFEFHCSRFYEGRNIFIILVRRSTFKRADPSLFNKTGERKLDGARFLVIEGWSWKSLSKDQVGALKFKMVSLEKRPCHRARVFEPTAIVQTLTMPDDTFSPRKCNYSLFTLVAVRTIYVTSIILLIYAHFKNISLPFVNALDIAATSGLLILLCI